MTTPINQVSEELLTKLLEAAEQISYGLPPIMRESAKAVREAMEKPAPLRWWREGWFDGVRFHHAIKRPYHVRETEVRQFEAYYEHDTSSWLIGSARKDLEAAKQLCRDHAEQKEKTK